MDDLKQLFDAIVEGDHHAAKSLTEGAIVAGANPKVLLDTAMIPAMDEVGRRFEQGEYFVPELIISARAMKAGMAVIRPLLTARADKPAGRVALATVRGDLHDIGKNLVGTMLEGGGFEVVDLGVDVGPDKIVAAVKDQNVDIVALSALLTTTIAGMKLTIDKLKAEGVRDRVKVIIGGAPVTQKFANDIGADGFAETASGAVVLARSLMAGA